MRALALFGGTFDPVHYGHLRSAWEAAELLDADVALMPASVPPHRPQPFAPAGARVEMLEAALAGQSRLTVDERELRRDGPSYTVDTLRELRGEVGPRRALVLIVGIDAFAGLPTWHEWRALFDLAHIAVLARPGHEPAFTAELDAEFARRRAAPDSAWRESPAGAIVPLAVTPLEISATDIRRRIGAGEEPRFLLPEAVWARIRAQGWYRR
ncbi:nicotinate-nucleotide adenylyltransferase [Tahibacter soli]|uniref:Probable nicotinate-nucleotide adenylyltransferase n=1 Tax=Tahibacter soli TaxID=2983605 RepID=A0A9X3YJE0_9GAMM|nr:nicotinate-nucleotide adenylyltransferase [Tahibacter soli]MDC8011903.1 nicotinate-nucleotide adenylyltransferase [Tahibacter soli]